MSYRVRPRCHSIVYATSAWTTIYVWLQRMNLLMYLAHEICFLQFAFTQGVPVYLSSVAILHDILRWVFLEYLAVCEDLKLLWRSSCSLTDRHIFSEAASVEENCCWCTAGAQSVPCLIYWFNSPAWNSGCHAWPATTVWHQWLAELNWAAVPHAMSLHTTVQVSIYIFRIQTF